ncbi:hypothetical protein A0H81_14292 [Grifola frondosa]|uniref:Uncharacterized protein n=1 Tax=Grifola frondosa TaxID=5627 RepID=A0A1C7LLU9_GRIFR|nr:hypothetical protein A0H81_14292 [Grifola frondosa]
MKYIPSTMLLASAATYVQFVAAQVSLYIPGFDPQPITADELGVGADGQTTWRIGPGVTSGTYTQDAGIFGSATLIAGPSNAHLIYDNGGLSIDDNCAISGSLAFCTVVDSAAGTIESGPVTETAIPMEVQVGSATDAGTTTAAGNSSNTSSPTSTPSAGSNATSGPSNTGTQTSSTGSSSNTSRSSSSNASQTSTGASASQTGNGAARSGSAGLAALGVAGLALKLIL